jgi:DNA polymerase V
MSSRQKVSLEMTETRILGRKREEMPDPIAFTSLPSSSTALVSPTLDLNEYLVTHSAATFFFRMNGKAMVGAGVHPGDLLIVDRSMAPVHDNIVVAIVDGEFLVRRLSTSPAYELVAEESSTSGKPIAGKSGKVKDVEIWGVVTYSIHSTVHG